MKNTNSIVKNVTMEVIENFYTNNIVRRKNTEKTNAHKCSKNMLLTINVVVDEIINIYKAIIVTKRFV
tara:strand:- start:150 stop:353 length:204 start_codon:yes stop_codon:yes gene_type:complete